MSATPSPKLGTESAPSASSDLLGRTLSGDLRILGSLGEIAEGPLYRGQYPSGLEVVVLVLRRDRNDLRLSDDTISQLRLQRQLRQASQIRHPNVAAVYELGETSDGLVYAVMEQLAGELLFNILAVRGAVSVEEAVDLCLQAAAGLQAAHDAGVAHGNLSPSSILIVEGEGGSRVKLIRFSPVSFSTDHEGYRQVDQAAADYASPERRQGYPPDQKGDVFSLGAVLHHLLTGSPPQGTTDSAVPEALHTVLTQALAPSAAQRFQTIAAFTESLEAATAAMREPQTTRRSMGRSPAGIALIVVILAGLWQSHSAHHPVGAVRPVAEKVTRAPPAKSSGTPAASRGNRPLASPARAQTPPKQRSDSAARPSETSPQLSPFRRSHPWAAVPGQRFYFRSSCEVALRSTDLVYFKSGEEARAAGYAPSPVPGCR